VNVTPRRFESKARDDKKIYTVSFREALAAGDSVASVQWRSRPQGLSFEDQSNDGIVVGAKIGSGAMGQNYRVIISATTTLGEVLSPLVEDDEGIPLQVVGDPVSNQPNYRWWTP